MPDDILWTIAGVVYVWNSILTFAVKDMRDRLNSLEQKHDEQPHA